MCLYTRQVIDFFSGVQSEATLVSWRKAWHSEDNITPSSGGDVVALSAFLLTTLPDVLARKKLVQEIWESGANTIVGLSAPS